MKKYFIFLFVLIFTLCNTLAVYAAPATDSLDITVHKASVKPVIDGKVTAEEWGEAVMYQESGVGLTFFPDSVSKTSENGVKANIYMLWDEKGFYVAAVVEDETHFNQYTKLDIWNGDAFEFDTNFNTEDYTDRNRQCFGINNDGEIYGGSYKVASGVDWAENSDVEYAEYKAVVDGNSTIYEFYVPWENFCPDGASFAKIGNIFRANVQFHLATDGDYIEDQRYVVYDEATQESTYPNIILADIAQTAPATATAAESAAANEAAPASVSPQTSDSFVNIVAAFTIFTLLGAVVLTKKAKQ